MSSSATTLPAAVKQGCERPPNKKNNVPPPAHASYLGNYNTDAKMLGVSVANALQVIPLEFMTLTAEETITVADRVARRIVLLETIIRQIHSSLFLSAFGFADIDARAKDQCVDAWTRLSLLHRRLAAFVDDKEEEEDEPASSNDDPEEDQSTDDECVLIGGGARVDDEDAEHEEEQRRRTVSKKRVRPSESLETWWKPEVVRRSRSTLRTRMPTERLQY